jgi:tRNA pseudouridine38-40 synthase
MRIAVKAAYDGSRFHGSQRQGDDDPDSVEGSIADALRAMGKFTAPDPWPLNFASRTDSGVSSLGNVFAIDTEMDPDELLRGLNANLEGIWCWGWGRLRESQNIRWANSRWYRYHLPPALLDEDQVKALIEVLRKYVGEHDFSHLCRLEDEKNPVTLIEKADAYDLSGNGELVIVDIVGSRFLWQQVRRMVGAAISNVKGELAPDEFERLLSGSPEGAVLKDRVRPMPPTGLVLMDVFYKDVDLQVSERALDLALERSSEDAWRASLTVILNTALRSMKR